MWQHKQLSQFSSQWHIPTDLFPLTMWKAALFTLCLLMPWVDRVWSNDSHPSFYGVKLCGREFIRAVIFTCGGSRWRRSVAGSGKIMVVRLWTQFSQTVPLRDVCFLLAALIGEDTFDPSNTNHIPRLTIEQDHTESRPWRDQISNLNSMAPGFSRSTRLPISEELLELLQSADRKERDVVGGLSNACCKWGCSKSEISSLCWIVFLKYIHRPLMKNSSIFQCDSLSSSFLEFLNATSQPNHHPCVDHRYRNVIVHSTFYLYV